MSAAVGVVHADAEGRITDANAAFLTRLGLSQDEVRSGRLRCDTLTPPAWAGADAAALNEAMRDGACRPYDKEFLCRDGRKLPARACITRPDRTDDRTMTLVWWQPQAAANGDANPAGEQDTPMRGEALRGEALRGEAYWRALFARMFEGFCLGEMIYDSQQKAVDIRYLEANEGFARLVDRNLTDIIGQLGREVVPDIEAAWIQTYAHVVATGQPITVERVLPRLDRAYQVRAFRSGPGRFAAFFSDVTDRRRAEMALREINAELERRVIERTEALAGIARELQAEIARREATQEMLLQTQKLEALGQMVGQVAHDFNNVLAAILGNHDLLRTRLYEPEQLTCLDRGTRAANRGVALVRQLLAFARKAELSPVVVDVAQLVRAMEDMVLLTVGRQVRCQFELASDLWAVIADPVRLEAVLLNLAANARDAMPDGGTMTVTLRNLPAAAAPVELPAGDYVVIAVADTGGGMTSDVCARAIEPFFTTKPRGKGTGLGLASAHEFARQSGGTLRIDTAPGAGTTITLCLKRAQVEPDQNVTFKEHDDRRLHGNATVLVADADDGVRRVIAGMLRALGYAVLEAGNAEAAMAMMLTTGRIDLVVAEAAMATADKLRLADHLRETPQHPPMVVLTAVTTADPPIGERTLCKPFTGRQLAGLVLEALGRVPSPEDAQGGGVDRFRDRLRSAALRRAYERWKGLRHPPQLLPHADVVLADMAGLPASAFVVSVSEQSSVPGDSVAFGFRYVHFGRDLAERLGRSLAGESVDGAEPNVLGPLDAAYRRCVVNRVPSYDYARYAMDEGPCVLFERLLMPLAGGDGRITHLLGIVLFTELPATGGTVTTLP
ncbi:Histidine kinase [Rhodovastum atsumiense]|nr:ATP-binding protein [Rhodovastum atsumiense]CAH2604866.1 Histidine kinase [Rhodovastum atsumiense]